MVEINSEIYFVVAAGLFLWYHTLKPKGQRKTTGWDVNNFLELSYQCIRYMSSPYIILLSETNTCLPKGRYIRLSFYFISKEGLIMVENTSWHCQKLWNIVHKMMSSWYFHISFQFDISFKNLIEWLFINVQW